MQTAPQTLEAPTVTSEAENTLRVVKLSGRINYLHCDGDGDRGSHGVMTFVSRGGVPLFVKEVNSLEDFRLNYSVFRAMEDLI